MAFTPVKYFIYRGLRKSDFINAADDKKIVAKGPSNSELIKRLWEIHEDQNTPGADFLSKAIGFDPANQQTNELLDSYFFKKDPAFQLPFVAKGKTPGAVFHHAGNHEFGFEIVLEEGTFKADLAYVRKASHIVDVSTLPSGTDAEKFSLKLKREEILNFMDPAAFYGLHLDNSGKVEYRKANNSKGSRTGNAIYTNIIAKFHTKNKLYLDIRNENGDSYNFYGNYKGANTDPNHGKDLNIGTQFTNNNTNNLAATNYGTNSWPVSHPGMAHKASIPMRINSFSNCALTITFLPWLILTTET